MYIPFAGLATTPCTLVDDLGDVLPAPLLRLGLMLLPLLRVNSGIMNLNVPEVREPLSAYGTMV